MYDEDGHYLRIECDAPGCRRGLVNYDLGWTKLQPCPVCGGLGSLSLHAVCELIGEHETTVAKLLNGKRMRPKVAARICKRLTELVSMKGKQPELFC